MDHELDEQSMFSATNTRWKEIFRRSENSWDTGVGHTVRFSRFSRRSVASRIVPNSPAWRHSCASGSSLFSTFNV